MIKNYFKIALRNLAQQKVLSFINIVGLSIGLACFTLFLLFAVHEFSFDRFHKNVSTIYRVVEWHEGSAGRKPGGEAYGGVPLGPAIKNEFPDVENFIRIQKGFDNKLVKVNEKITRSKLSFADPGLLSVFSFKLIEGNTDALKDPHNIILTEEKAIQLFGATNVTGRRVDIKVEDEFVPFKVGAVVQNIPGNSSIQFNITGSFDYLLTTQMGKESINSWNMQIGCETYVKLRKESKLMNEPEKLVQFRKKHYPEEEAEFNKESKKEGKAFPFLPPSFRLQPMRDIHTDARIDGIASTIDPQYIWILIAIAAGILLIACINFTTLAIGRSAGRAKEVGVRKVMGGQRKQLIGQFITESLLLTFLSAVLALLLAKFLLPFFNELSGVPVSFSVSQFPELIWLLAGLVLLTGFLAGIYPALVLSGFKPVEVLKSKIRLGGSNFFTKSLVTLQFVLSVSLIISTVIILQQLKYMRSKNIGFTKENVVVVDVQGADAVKIYPLIKQKLQSGTGIMGIAASEMGMGEGTGLMGTGFENKGEVKGVIMYPVDAGFLQVMNMQLIAGRDFDPSLSTDTAGSIIVNEALLGDFGLTVDNAIGQVLTEKQFGSHTVPRTIIGIVKNFNYSRLDKNIRPQMFYQPPVLQARKFYIRIKAGDPASSLAAVNEAWKSVVPGLSMQYSFLDEDFNRFYQVEEKWGSIVGCAGIICILLACLGLFGLAALTAANRTKEIGIRKVLGASVSSVIGLISKDFLKLVTAAIVIAIPLTWWGMHKWLEDYAYRINIGWWVFAATGILALLIALFTVSLRAVRIALANPVKSLRTE